MKIANMVCVMLAIALLGCERLAMDLEDAGDNSPNAIGANYLGIKTRGVTTRDAETGSSTEKVSYPVYVYAFNEKKQCIGLRMIEGPADPLEFNLIRGAYKICAIGVDAGEHYTLPSQSSCTPESPISLKSGYSHADLMASSANVMIEEGESNNLTLQMERKVLKVESISMKNIPSDVTGMSVTISPLGSSLLVNGDIYGKSDYKVVDLMKNEATDTWVNKEELYMLASDSKATVKVSLTYNDGERTEAYTYTSNETLESNYIVNISGVFKAREIVLSGTIQGVDWAGTKNISFLMDEVSGDTQEIPAVGTIYKGCYVMRHIQEGQNKTVVTLMSLGEKTGLVFEDDEDQASLSAAIDMGLKELSNGEIELRMPNLSERYYLTDHIDEINRDMKRLKATSVTLNKVDSDNNPADRVGYYMRRTSNNKVTLYFVKSRKTDPNDKVLPSESATCHLRGFATITF